MCVFCNRKPCHVGARWTDDDLPQPALRCASPHPAPSAAVVTLSRYLLVSRHITMLDRASCFTYIHTCAPLLDPVGLRCLTQQFTSDVPFVSVFLLLFCASCLGHGRAAMMCIDTTNTGSMCVSNFGVCFCTCGCGGCWVR